MSFALEVSIYAMVHASTSPTEIEELFRLAGWRTRKAGWDEFEARSEFSEIDIFADIFTGEPVLISGEVVADSLDGLTVNCNSIVQVLSQAGLHGSYECYDDDHQLLIEQEF